MSGLASEMLTAFKGHEEIFRYWRSLKKHGKLPSRDDLDLVMIRKLLPNISLIDVLIDTEMEKKTRFRQRLAGTGLYAAYGAEITGKYLEDIYPPAEEDYWRAELSQVIKSRKVNVGLHSLAWRGVDGLVLFWMRLPLASDGVSVDMILGYDALLGKKDSIATGIRAA